MRGNERDGPEKRLRPKARILIPMRGNETEMANDAGQFPNKILIPMRGNELVIPTFSCILLT